MPPEISQQVLRADALQLALGVLVMVSGIAASLIFIPRARRRDYTLLFFGIAAAMYGLRLLVTTPTTYMLYSDRVLSRIDWVITAFIPVPLGLFFAEVLATKWKKLIYWIVAVQFVEGIFYVTSHLLGRALDAAEIANAVMVLLTFPVMMLLFISEKKPTRELWILRFGFGVFMVFVVYTNVFTLRGVGQRRSTEYIGFVVLLCCLGYLAAAQTLKKEEQLSAIERELEIARQIQAGLLPDHNAVVPGLQIATRYIPATSVAGDFYDFLKADGCGLGILIADVTGHGVPAALSASMVKVAIRAQSERMDRPADVLAGLNTILCGNLQGQFVTAGYVYLDVAGKQLSYSGAGHPPLLLWRNRHQNVAEIEENGIFLGAFSETAYSSRAVCFEPGDRCLLYTDGILEAPNQQGEEFGSERLRDFLVKNRDLSTQQFCDALVSALDRWCARPADREQHDDLTLVAVDFVAPS